MSIGQNDIVRWTVYRITSPSNRVYVGITCQFNKRFSVYRSKSTSRQTLIYNSIKKYGFDSHRIDILDEFNGNLEYANGKEMFWIRTFMSNKNKYPQQNGLNLTDGGDGTRGYKMSPELREHHSNIRKGKKLSEETKRKISEAGRGRKMNFTHLTPEYIQKLSERNKLYKHTEEAKKKIGEASKRTMKGRKLSEETKEKLRQINLGKKYSEETKKKLSTIRKGRKINRVFTDEQRKAMSEMKKGFKHTEEAKRKISEHGKGNSYCLGRKHSEEEKARRRESIIGVIGRKIIQTIEGVEVKEFPSISTAYRELGIGRKRIKSMLGKGGCYNGYNLKYKL